MGKFSPNVIANCLVSCAKYNLDGELVVYGDRRITWGEMVDRSFRMANALIDLGIKKDDKITFMFHNTPEFIETNFAIQAAGAVPVPMNYRFMPREIEFQADHSDACVFIYDALFRDAVEKAAPNLSGIKTFIRYGEGELEALDYEDFLKSGKNGDPRVSNDWEDVAVMIYTGGTTGFPKGVMLTYGGHRDMFANLLGNVLVRAADLDLTGACRRPGPQQGTQEEAGGGVADPGASVSARGSPDFLFQEDHQGRLDLQKTEGRPFLSPLSPTGRQVRILHDHSLHGAFIPIFP